jgi:hypothetical protein
VRWRLDDACTRRAGGNVSGALAALGEYFCWLNRHFGQGLPEAELRQYHQAQQQLLFRQLGGLRAYFSLSDYYFLSGLFHNLWGAGAKDSLRVLGALARCNAVRLLQGVRYRWGRLHGSTHQYKKMTS